MKLKQSTSRHQAPRVRRSGDHPRTLGGRQRLWLKRRRGRSCHSGSRRQKALRTACINGTGKAEIARMRAYAKNGAPYDLIEVMTCPGLFAPAARESTAMTAQPKHGWTNSSPQAKTKPRLRKTTPTDQNARQRARNGTKTDHDKNKPTKQKPPPHQHSGGEHY